MYVTEIRKAEVRESGVLDAEAEKRKAVTQT